MMVVEMIGALTRFEYSMGLANDERRQAGRKLASRRRWVAVGILAASGRPNARLGSDHRVAHATESIRNSEMARTRRSRRRLWRR
jgi:hypothetical protein